MSPRRSLSLAWFVSLSGRNNPPKYHIVFNVEDGIAEGICGTKSAYWDGFYEDDEPAFFNMCKKCEKANNQGVR